MAFPAVTYTFSNATTADATQVNQNFTDIINGVSDGTKNISISALTAAGASSLQGAVTLGASSSNDLTVNASLASTIPIKTTTSYDIGSTSIGLRALYLGDAGSAARCTKILGATIASGWTLTLPTAVPGGASYILEATTGGASSWTSRTDMAVVSKTTTYVATRADDVILCSGSVFTVTLPAASGSMKRFVIKKTDSSLTNIITIARAGSDTIDGGTSTTLNTQYESIEIVSDGTSAWNVITRSYPTNWVTYTPTFVGFGTVTNITAQSKRNGPNLDVIAVFTTGTVSASTASMTVGYNGTSANVSGSLSSYNVGSASHASNAVIYYVLAAANTTVNFSFSAGGAGSLQTTLTGSGGFNSSTVTYVNFSVPISGWN